jgi:hypothetical protein
MFGLSITIKTFIMKKLTISSALLILVILIMSCKKDTGFVNRASTPASATAAALLDTHTVISEWVSLSFDQVFDDNGEVYLQAASPFNSYAVFDKNKHVELAYVSMPGQQTAVISRLPMRLDIPLNSSQNSTDKVYAFDFRLDNSGFFVAVKNVYDGTLFPDPTNIQDLTYRYIIIPKILYDSLYIDWNNYDEVLQALNL